MRFLAIAVCLAGLVSMAVPALAQTPLPPVAEDDPGAAPSPGDSPEPAPNPQDAPTPPDDDGSTTDPQDDDDDDALQFVVPRIGDLDEPDAPLSRMGGRDVLVMGVTDTHGMVIIDGGTDVGIRHADRLRVVRNGAPIADLVAIDVRDTIAFCTVLVESTPIREGDRVYRVILSGASPNRGPQVPSPWSSLSNPQLQQLLNQTMANAAEAYEKLRELRLSSHGHERLFQDATMQLERLREENRLLRADEATAYHLRDWQGHSGAIATVRVGFGQDLVGLLEHGGETPTYGWQFGYEHHFAPRWWGFAASYRFTQQPAITGESTLQEEFAFDFFNHELPLRIGYRHRSFPIPFKGVSDSDEFVLQFNWEMPATRADTAWPGRGVNPPRLGIGFELVKSFSRASGLDLRLKGGFAPWATFTLNYNVGYFVESSRWGAFALHLRLPVLQGVAGGTAVTPRVLPFWEVDPDEDWLNPFLVLEVDWITPLDTDDYANALRIAIALRLSL